MTGWDNFSLGWPSSCILLFTEDFLFIEDFGR